MSDLKGGVVAVTGTFGEAVERPQVSPGARSAKARHSTGAQRDPSPGHAAPGAATSTTCCPQLVICFGLTLTIGPA